MIKKRGVFLLILETGGVVVAVFWYFITPYVREKVPFTAGIAYFNLRF